MKNYIEVLKNDISKNEAAKGLGFITLIMAFIFGSLFIGTWVLQGTAPQSNIAFVFPVLFGVLTVVHLFLRPFVLIRMGQK